MAHALPNEVVMRLVALCFVIVTLGLGTAPSGRQQSALEVAAALQAKYDRIRDFSADFTQHVESSILRRKVTEKGRVRVKKPGKMRWDYTTPEEKLFVSDGERISLYVPADNQVTISQMPKQDEATTAVLFLAGKGDLTRDFKVSFAENADPGTHALRLDPKIPERDYEWLELVVDRSSLQIRSLSFADRQGGRNVILLSNYKENVGIPDKTFAFQPPRGADVIYSDNTSR